jgi:serine/threonine protein kinase
MPTDSPKHPLELCRSCGQVLDISAVLPLSVVACPVCSTSTTVLRYVGPFHLERLLGQGGMGAVYQAHDIGLHRSVALKVLNRNWSHDHQVTAQFEREATLTARVNHPNVVRVYSSGLSHGIFYIAMELVTEGSLEKWMAETGPLPEVEVVRAGIQIAQGLLAAQSAGLIHRDIKPANILFAEGRLPKIVDFGLALPASDAPANKEDSEVWGTPDYIAPESLESKTEDFRSDIYALGATLWHALTGSPPHKADTPSIRRLLEIKKKPIDLMRVLPKAHPATVRAFNRALAFRPEDRHADYSAFIRELQSALHSLEPDSKHLTASGSREWIKNAALGFLALLSIGSLALWFLNFKLSSPEPNLPVGEQLVPEETRLRAAIHLMASGRLKDANAVLEKLLHVREIDPGTAAWCRLALATLYSADGQPERRKFLLESLSTTLIKKDPSLAQWFRRLPGVASEPLPPDPNANPSRTAIHLLCEATRQLDLQNWKQAQDTLEKAFQLDASAWKEVEASSLISFARWIHADLSLLLEIQTLLSSQAANPPGTPPSLPPASLEKADALSRRISLVKPIRLHVEASLRKSRELVAKTVPKTPPPAATTATPAAPNAAPAPAPASAPVDPAAAEKIDALRKDIAALGANFQFNGALKTLQDFSETHPNLAPAAAHLVPPLRVSAFFFEWVIREINRGNSVFPHPPLRSGAPFPANPTRADTTKLLLETQNGSSTEIPWSQIAPGYLLSIANVRLAHIQDPTARAEILFMAGNFQFALGAREKGLATLRQAADINSAYLEELKLLITNP